MKDEKLPEGISPERVAEMIQQTHSNYHRIEESWEQLVESHEGDWVASYEGELVLGATIEEVLAEATKRAWPLGVIAIDQIRRERANVLF
ncbi:MAG: hypothetical protein WEB52_04550 [Dehalococcoidia bacterium]